MTLPLFHLNAPCVSERGERAIGQVYAANTLGSIAGVLFAVHVGLPLLGLQRLITLGAAIDVFLGLALLYRSSARQRMGTVARAAFAGAAAVVVVAVTVHLEPRRLASGVFRYNRAQLADQYEVLSDQDGKTSSVSLTSAHGVYVLAQRASRTLGYKSTRSRLPPTTKSRCSRSRHCRWYTTPPRRTVANIGLGLGLTTDTLLADPAVERVDTVEIEPAIIKAARGFGYRVERTFTDPRSHIHAEDAKKLLQIARVRRHRRGAVESVGQWRREPLFRGVLSNRS